MKRREFIILASGAAAWPLAAHAQQPMRMRRIGVLMGLTESDPEGPPRVAIFKRGLQSLGWTEGRNLQIEYRWAGGDANRTRTLAAELARTMPDVVVAHLTVATAALMQETSIPIIFAVVADPVGSGLVGSLARPGGLVTGFPNFVPSLGGKWVEMLKEISPRLRRVGILFNPETAAGEGSFYARPIQAAASTLAIESTLASAGDAIEIEDGLVTLSRDADSGLIVMPDIFTTRAFPD